MKRKVERLKDILIDHVYDYGYNEMVQRVEGGGNTVTFDDPAQIKEPEMAAMVKHIRKSGKWKAHYTTRNEDYCTILEEPDLIHKSLIQKLKYLGFSKGKKLPGQIKEAKNFLIARSYMVSHNPLKEKVKLTEKGIGHYLDGKSFEDAYINRRNSNIAVVISIGSIVIALIALFA